MKCLNNAILFTTNGNPGKSYSPAPEPSGRGRCYTCSACCDADAAADADAAPCVLGLLASSDITFSGSSPPAFSNTFVTVFFT